MNDSRIYDAFNRRIITDNSISLPLPIRSDPPGRTDEYPPIRIRRDAVPACPATVDAELEQVYADPSGGFDAYVADDTIYWFDDAIGALCVRNGTEITISPAPSASETAVGRFVAESGLRTAIGQQGDLVLHASAAVVDGKAVAFTGPSGRGKSTAAAACAAHGHPVLADDATVLAQGTATVLPGTEHLDLDAEARTAVTGPVSNSDGSDPTVSAKEREPRPLAAIYILEDDDRFETTRLTSSQAMFELLRMSDALYADDDRKALESHMAAASTLADTVPISRFQRPRSLSALDEFVARLEADLS